MKKIFKNPFLTFILGVVLTIGITSVFAYSFLADNVEFHPSDTNWEVNDVNQALNNLHDRITCNEWEEILDSTAANASYVYSHVIYLYKCGNICKVTFALNNVAAITNPKYYPKEKVNFSGIGAGNGYCEGEILTNGNIKVTTQYNVTGKWASANNIAYIC